MTLAFDTSRVKAQLSEFIGRVAYGRTRILVLRHGKPVAALVSVEDLGRLEALDASPDAAAANGKHPITSVFGAWGDSPEMDGIEAEIYADRLRPTQREISL
jgi:prevent-host-death family protein